MATTKTPKVTAAIKERNRHYDKATNAGKRVMLAREVLRLIKIGALKPYRGVYVDPVIPLEMDLSKSAQPYIASGEVHCRVCAKGALFIAAISIRNQLTLADLYDDSHMNGLIRDSTDKKDTFGLVKLFGTEVTAAIENWFEHQYRYECTTVYMLEAIMKNIIKNKGNFSESYMEQATSGNME